MNKLLKWAILMGLLLAALVCYGYGSSTGAIALVFAGLAFELAFWVGAFRRKRHG